MKSLTDDFYNRDKSSSSFPEELFYIYKEDPDDKEGAPLEEWFYTQGMERIEYNSDTYYPAAIRRSAAEFDTEMQANTVKIYVESSNEIAQYYVAWPPIEVFWIKILAIHRDQSPYEANVLFIGQIKSVSFQDRIAVMDCVSFDYLLKKPVLSKRYQIHCNNFLFDEHCDPDGTLAIAHPAVTCTIDTVSSDGLTLTSSDFSSKDSGYFTHGVMKFGHQRSRVVSHSGSTIKVMIPFSNISPTDSVDVYAGCDGDLVASCVGKFDNMLNFFGTPFVPWENPCTRTV